MTDQLILFGKYHGLTYQQLIDKDINYCKFIARCPANQKTEDFKHFLDKNLETILKKKDHDDLMKKLAQLT